MITLCELSRAGALCVVQAAYILFNRPVYGMCGKGAALSRWVLFGMVPVFTSGFPSMTSRGPFL